VEEALFLLVGAFFREFSNVRRDIAVVLLSASAITAFMLLSLFCTWATPEMKTYLPLKNFQFFSDVGSGITCLTLYVAIGLGLLLIFRK
jgi:hypothetical protein